MKAIYKFSLVALAVAGLAGCNQEQAKDAPAQTAQTEQAAATTTLTTPEQKESYSIGASFGAYMQSQIAEQEKLGMPVDRALIIEGFTDGLDNKMQLSEEDMQTVLQGLDKKLNDKRVAQAQELATKTLEEGKKFLEENAKKEGVTTTDSGLQYEVITAGTGDKPAATDTVEVNYRGTLIDGTEFDSSYKRGESIKFPLNRVIPGWTEGVQLMPVGSKYKFVIPSELAYGERDTGTIPANSTLVFEVELLGIDQPAEAAQ
ncbi:FKBP-type peptidyl-prolyl cis-trans isomerase [Shewanella corallii]|uniref:Peptidyl-prolyl cis-trans isomerase n=2 Tax=Shewanella TaxID=22 RepID=A0ABT0N594_9GAMM|nr:MULTISPECIES: FKBP-type peptidyl-prolyl cis-trans isomerase [Shewanella]MCL1037143.1 FKBP-type peptidyl-prolyl cis-trans isomerase [Shewanella submarina]MCL2913633.1 FKBP-type peptidyl-prolyl cis-trans isomerase [Shewanella corallii]